jgi:hypothetical protein
MIGSVVTDHYLCVRWGQSVVSAGLSGALTLAPDGMRLGIWSNRNVSLLCA